MHITASDDGLNAAGSLSADTSAQGETTGYVQTAFGGMGMVDQDAKLEISGGYVYINADGDGIDSNNGVIITGGTELTSFTVSDRITTAGSNAGGMNPWGGGFPGGQDGMMPPDRQEQGAHPSFDGQEPPEDMTPPDGFDPTQEGKTPPGGFGGFDSKANTGNA